MQGDVILLVDVNGSAVAYYEYDLYGNVIQALGSHSQINPLRYRGYYYDNDTGMYYLQSRYYDPKICRFINADSLTSTGQDAIGYNMFAYCGNNPVSRSDPSGYIWRVALLAVICAAALSGCSNDSGPYSGQANCYAYALKLEYDPETGEPFKSAPDPGSFAGKDLSKSELYASPEYVKKMMEDRISKDAEALGLNFTEVFYPGKHVPAEGNWLIYIAYCPDPSRADYHFWRKEADGTWSHKPGTRDIMYEDFSGNTITDPMFPITEGIISL